MAETEELEEMDSIEDSFRSKVKINNSPSSKLALARYLAEYAEKTDTAKLTEADTLFNEAIQMISNKPSLLSVEKRELARIHSWYAVFLESQSNYNEAEDNYKKALVYDPRQALAMGNYAVFMQKIRRNRLEATRLYEEAIAAHPNHVTIIVKFASLKKACGDLEGADRLYKKAVDLKVNLSDSAGAYAVFLHAVTQDPNLAQNMYEKAVEADPSHANNLSNYGLFLSDVRHDYDKAEKLYQAALQAEPGHANALYNYAVLLDSSLHQPDKAEAMYRDVLKQDPRHAFALYNIAVLLEEKLCKSRDGDVMASGKSDSITEGKSEVRMLYERAVEAAPKDSLSRADLGRFLLVRAKDYVKAQEELEKALDLDPSNAVALYNLGLMHADKASQLVATPSAKLLSSEKSASFNQRPSTGGSASSSGGGSASRIQKGDKQCFEKAASYWRKLVDEVEPNHANGLRRLGRLEMEQFNKPQAADKRYVSALNSLHNTLSSSSTTRSSGGGGSTSSATSAELDGLIAEVLTVMDKAPAKFDQSRLLAEKLKRR